MSPTTEDLRRVLEERAAGRGDDVLALADPAHAAAGPRLAAVHARVRRARRLRAAAAAGAVAAVTLAALAWPGVVTSVDGTDRREPPASRSAPATFDEDGLPPASDAWGRPLTAATSLHTTGPRYEELIVAPRSDEPDAGLSYTVRCTGDQEAVVRLSTGGAELGTAVCGRRPLALFTARSTAAWAQVGVEPGSPIALRMEFMTTGSSGRATAVLAVYGGSPPVPPILDSSPLPADIGLVPLLASVELRLVDGLTVRAVRIVPDALDSFFVATVCSIAGDSVPDVRIRIAETRGVLTCSASDQGETIAWPIVPSGDVASFWSEQGLEPRAPVTVLLAVSAPLPPDPDLGRLDLGIYGMSVGRRPPNAAVGLDEPPTSDGSAPERFAQLTTGSPTSESFDGPLRARRFAAWIQCGGRDGDVGRLAVRVRFNSARAVVLRCADAADRAEALDGEFDPALASDTVWMELVTPEEDRWVPATGLDGRTVARVALYVLDT